MDGYILSLILNFIFIIVLIVLVVLIRFAVWEWFLIGFKLWRNKSLVLVQRVYNSGIVKFNVEKLANKIPFGATTRNKDEIVIGKKIHQRLDSVSINSLQEDLKQIKPEKLRSVKGVPLVVLKQDFHENIDLVNLFKPDVDAEQVQDAITQAYDTGYEDGIGNRSAMEKMVKYTLVISGISLLFIIIAVGLIGFMSSNLDTLINNTVPALQGQIGSVGEQVAEQVKDVVEIV